MSNNVYQLHTEEARLEQVSQWIARIDRGLDETEQRAFRHWMSEHPQNRQLMMQMAALWDKMDALSQLSEVIPHTPQQPKRPFARNLSIAASFLLVGLLSVSLWLGGVFDTDTQQVLSEQLYTTQIGEQASFTMPDDSELVLNTNSQVKVTYTDKQRLFELQRGELHIKVAHHHPQPLSVHAGGKIIQAVGTAFNVELGEEHVELIVTDGKVRVAAQDASLPDPLQLEQILLPVDSLLVSKGEKIALGTEQQNIVRLGEDELEASLSWRQGTLIFRGESLEQAMREVSRYTALEFELADDDLKQVQIAGLFRTDDLDGLLAALEESFDIRHQRIGTGKIRLRRIGSP